MPRRIRIGEVKTKALDYLLLAISLLSISTSVVCVYFLVTTLPEFQVVPFTEFVILFGLGLIGIRTWRAETTL
ncbi:MAG TPA: hypothetical protein VKK79_22415 [Candidatus Lokiarchaeia archaeon]|nr:hypothetical protein [Candidatus Lokiarchaeia archaeon]